MGSVSNNIDVKAEAQKIINQSDMALGMMAQDIEMMAVFNAPVDTGKMARYIKKYRVSFSEWKISVNVDYAQYQERGMRADGSHRVVNYSRPGSGAHFLERAVKVASSRVESYFDKASRQSLTSGKISSKTDFG